MFPLGALTGLYGVKDRVWSRGWCGRDGCP